MKIDKLNSWLTLASNMGVIAGIVFLAIQISQSNQQAQSSTYQARINEIDQSHRELALSEEMTNIYVKIEESGANSLTASERMRAEHWERARQMRMQGNLFQYQLGYLDENAYREMILRGQSDLPLWKELGIDSGPVYSDLIRVLEAESQGSQ